MHRVRLQARLLRSGATTAAARSSLRAAPLLRSCSLHAAPSSASASSRAIHAQTGSSINAAAESSQGVAPKPKPHLYDPRDYAEQTEARVAAAAAAAANASANASSGRAGAAPSSAGSSFLPHPTPRSQFLGDLSRVLLGLSMVLQHSASLGNEQLADAARTFAKQNEKSWPAVQDLRELARDRCEALRNKKHAGSSGDQATDASATNEPNAPHNGGSGGSSGLGPHPFDPSSLLSSLPPLPSVSQLSSVPSDLLSHTSRLVAQGEQVAESLAKHVEQTTREINRQTGGLVPDAAIDGLVEAQRQALRQAMRVGQQLGFASRKEQDDALNQEVEESDEWPPTPHKNSNDALYAREHIRHVRDLHESHASFSSQQQQQPATSRDWSQTSNATSNPVAAASKLVADATNTVASGVAGAQKAVAGAAQAASQAAASTAAAAANTAASVANSAASTAASAASAAASAGPFGSAAHAPASSFNTFSDFTPRERTVPSSPLARIAGFSQIASSIIFGTIKDKVTGVFSGSAEPAAGSAAQAVDARSEAERAGGAMPAPAAGERASQNMMGGSSGSTASSSAGASAGSRKPAASAGNPVLNSFLSEANTERLAEGLCRMRGAALKVGQMLSIQDESLVPPQLQAVLDRVRDGADVMPRKQLERALSSELGEDWESRLSYFEWKPLAAASIGQVHLARLRDGREVVMKVQYPGVAESINSDVNNLKRLIRFVNVLPKGMYIDETMRAAKEELALECDYTNEALAQKKFKKLVANDKAFYVPAVIDEFSTKRILTTERIYGLPIDRLSPVPVGSGHEGAGSGKIFVESSVRNNLCQSLLRLVLHELFVYRFMQTDPNWSNFLYNPNAHKIYLIDFGASRLYKKQFVDEYLRMVHACAVRDRQGVINSSIKLGFLTGDESTEFLNAHVEAGFVIGEPFGSDQAYDFVKGNIAARVSALAAVMLRDRLTAPPKEAYTLHRKLSGAFLTCRKLEAKIQCKDDFMRLYNNYQFGPELPLVYGSASKDSVESRLKPE